MRLAMSSECGRGSPSPYDASFPYKSRRSRALMSCAYNVKSVLAEATIYRVDVPNRDAL